MPPALDAGVMSRAKLAALWAAKAPALLEIQLQKQPAWFAFKSTFPHFPSRLQLQGRRKQSLRCHRPDSVPPSQGFTRARNETLLPSHRAPCAPNLKESFLISPFRQAELNEPEECFRMELNQVF
jgi:hypothetical protein